MRQINPAWSSNIYKKTSLFSVLSLFFSLCYGQICPTPFAVGDLDSTLRNVPVSTVVTANDITYYGSGLPLTGDSLSIAQAPAHGTVVILNDSTIEYIPTPGFVGTDFYIYTVCNSCGNCAQASVSIQVKPYCPAPMAVADYDTVYNNIPKSLHVTSNDQNIAGGPLTVSILHTSRHGSDSLSGTQIVYTCTAPGYVGADTLVYQEKDTCTGSSADSASVYLTVITCVSVVAVNALISVQQLSTVSENLDTVDLHVNGFGNTTVTLLGTPKYGGTASVNGTAVTYMGGPNGFGKDSLKYQICTDCGCDTGFLIFNVTEKPCSKPTALPDSVYAGYSANCTSIYDILANDTIPINGGALTVSIVGAPSYGIASIVNGKLHYTCTDSTQAGQIDRVGYSICNACYCDTSYVVINITHYPCNGLNPVTRPDTAYVCKNYSVNVDVYHNDYSPQGLTIAVQSITGQGAHGTGIVVNDSTIKYTPDSGFCGDDYIVYQLCDNGTPSLCSTGTVSIHVACCNVAPVVLNSANSPTDTLHISVYEETSTIYCFNYIEADSPQVRIAYISSSLDTVTADTSAFGTQLCITITPPNNSRAQQIDTVTICNENPLCTTVILYLSVIPLDHAPIATSDTIRYIWGNTCTGVNVVSRDTDIDPGDHITISSYHTVTADGGSVSQQGDSILCYTADSSFTGIDTIEYTICDTSGECDSSYVIVIVPILARSDEGLTKQDSTIYINVTGNDTYSSNEYVRLCSSPQHGTVAIDSGNIVQYTPVHDYPVDPINTDTNLYQNGVDSFCYTLCAVSGGDTSCSSTEVYVMILPLSKFYIPQGISPNGDNVNDVFVIASVSEFPSSQLLVYNRYGDEVWRNDGNGYNNDFDGTWKKNGQPLPDGSYWYIFKFNDGSHPDRMGYIVIQR